MSRPSRASVSSTAASCEFLRERIQVALGLAIGNNPTQAHRALANVQPMINPGDPEIMALYLQARAIASIKARMIDRAFETFELAVETARINGDGTLYGKILINYGTAEVQDGGIELAIPLLEEALETHRSLKSSTSEALISLGEALFAAGDLQHAAAVLHEFHAMQGKGSATKSDLFLAAAAVGIPVGMMLPDEALLGLSNDPALLDLGFAMGKQWLLGPLAEAFCMLYEYEGRRDEHDMLLTRCVDSFSSLDNSLNLAIRVARLGAARHLPRFSALMSRQCPGTSSYLRAHKDVFDSFIQARRQIADRARQFGLRAAREFTLAARPFMQALALEAAGLIEEAREVRHRCGARAEAIGLRWTGTPVDRRLLTELTPRESQVAQFAARGLTNRKIAITLGLSERTVHRHCESIFSKFGIRSRWQLTAATGGALNSDGE